MNAERLHAAVLLLRDGMQEQNAIAGVQGLVQTLGQVTSARDQVALQQHQKLLGERLDALRAALSESRVHEAGPAYAQIFAEIGAANLLGRALQVRIDDVFAKNGITPTLAFEELNELLAELQWLKSAIDNCLTAFKAFEIGRETLEEGECEIGVLIPRADVASELVTFTKELKTMALMLNTFSEVATGKKEKLTITTLSSSDLLIYLKAGLPYAACVAVAIERTVAVYKQLLEIRRLRVELGRQGVPDESAAGIDKFANSFMTTKLDEVTDEIMKRFYKSKGKAGRKNELRNALGIALNILANRIDRGFGLEVRVGESEQTEEDEAVPGKDAQLVAAIRDAMRGMRFLVLEGRAVLALPEKAGGRTRKGTHTD